jgi:transcriptional regulator with XRE-family HTH domain
MRFKDVLRDLRTKSGLTQEQLAGRAEIPLSSLRGHEQGQRIPSWASVVKLSKALGVSCDAFADCDEVKTEATAEPPKREPSQVVVTVPETPKRARKPKRK